jgi:tetratricopeptide (TPR) repeat protein
MNGLIVRSRAIGFYLAFLVWLIPAPVSAQLAQRWTRCVNADNAFSFDIAINACTAIIQSGNESLENQAIALINRAVAHNRKGFYEKAAYDDAIADSSRAIELNPDFAVAYAQRAFAYNKKGAYDDAIADLNRAIELDPDFAQAYSQRGFAHNEKGAYDDAIADLNRAIELDPDFAVAYAQRAFAYDKKSAYDDGIADLNRAIELDPDFAVAYAQRGLAYNKKGAYDDAIADLNRAIELDPDFAQAYAQRGSAYNRKGAYDVAIANLNRAINLNPTDAYPYAERSLSYNAKGFYDHAIRDSTHAIQLNPNEAAAYVQRGFAHFRKGAYQFAIPDLDLAIQINPKLVGAFNTRGDIYKQIGRPDLATANYDEALRLLLNPAFTVSFPDSLAGLGSMRGVNFVAPPLPNADQLRQCRGQSGGEEDFLKCVVSQALPQQYRIASECKNQNADDGGRALICSTGKQELLNAYDKYKAVNACTRTRGTNKEAVADCIGKITLGENEQYYLSCVTKNKGDYKTAAVCAFAKDLTPEQQIALSCAISTGGQPHAFAVCAGGQLLARELDKCWQNGVATENGCFGPNNEYRKLLRIYDGLLRQAFGDQSAVYQAYKLWQDNVLAPGRNHEFVKAFNNGLHDIQNGPGPNNEYVKAGKALAEGIQSVGKAFGL